MRSRPFAAQDRDCTFAMEKCLTQAVHIQSNNPRSARRNRERSEWLRRCDVDFVCGDSVLVDVRNGAQTPKRSEGVCTERSATQENYTLSLRRPQWSLVVGRATTHDQGCLCAKRKKWATRRMEWSCKSRCSSASGWVKTMKASYLSQTTRLP